MMFVETNYFPNMAAVLEHMYKIYMETPHKHQNHMVPVGVRSLWGREQCGEEVRGRGPASAPVGCGGFISGGRCTDSTPTEYSYTSLAADTPHEAVNPFKRNLEFFICCTP